LDISLHHPDDATELARLIRQAAVAKQRDRLRAIELAVAGETTPTIMRTLKRSRGFVQRWCYVYRDHGLDAVRAQSPPGRPTRLPPQRHEAFKQRVLAGPTESDGVCTLRGRDMIEILGREFGVRYELSGVYALLGKLGLSVLTPREQHRDNDPEAMRRWEEAAPFLSGVNVNSTKASTSRSGSRTKHASVNKAR
jgi:transposase